MQIIKLDAIDSTNSFLKRLIRETKVKDNTVITAKYQTGGRGQMGNNWASEPGKNLMFSVFKAISYLDKSRYFYISMAVALALHNALKKLQIPDVYIKWPNDILSGKKKLCGILIENVIKNDKKNGTIIGVGLNVNQQVFPYLDRASSLKNITGITYAVDEVLQVILKELQLCMDLLENGEFAALKTAYETHLFRIRTPSAFKDKNNVSFMGFIEGITGEGHLIIRLEEGIIKTFDLKEVQLLF